MGLEIEFENWDGGNVGTSWTPIRDGSLRNNGIEFVTTGPTGGEALTTALNEWEAFSGKHLTDRSVSYRTSMHVHVDVRDFTIGQFMNLIVLYPLLEHGMFRFTGHDREHNIYCVPWNTDQAMPAGLIKYLSAIMHGKYKPNTSSGRGIYTSRKKDKYGVPDFDLGKYSALNPLRLSDLGTVEFRHLLTTANVERYTQWINACLSVVKFAFDYEGEPRDILGMLSLDGCQGLYERVFGANASLFYDPEIESSVWESIPLLEDLLMLIESFESAAEPANVPPNLDYVEDGGLLCSVCPDKVEAELRRRKSTRAIGVFVNRDK